MSQESVPTADVKSVFFDIASFTQRTVEAQTEVIGVLNGIVKGCLAEISLPIEDPGKCLVLPTGDGMCICLVNQHEPIDLHIQLAKRILAKLHEHNEGSRGTELKFALRIGVNSNVDNLVTDIAGRPNIAGGGINQAQRLMVSADHGQIMLGRAVYEVLHQRKAYADAFKKFSTTDKNGVGLEVYQLIQQGLPGLNIEVPSQFRPKTVAPKKLPRHLAYHAALCQKHRASIRQMVKNVFNDDVVFFSIWVLASDYVSKEGETESYPHHYQTKPSFESPLEEIVAYYKKVDSFVIREFDIHLRERWWDFRDYFEASQIQFGFLFPTSEGLQKVEQEHPGVLSKVGAVAK